MLSGPRAQAAPAEGPVRTLTSEVQGGQIYFVRVQAHDTGDESSYSIEAKWGGDEILPLPVTPQPKKEEPKKEEKKPEKEPEEDMDMGGLFD